MTNYYLAAILVMLIAIYYQGEMREMLSGRSKSLTGLFCSLVVPIILIVGAITH